MEPSYKYFSLGVSPTRREQKPHLWLRSSSNWSSTASIPVRIWSRLEQQVDPFAKVMPAVPHGIILIAVDGGRDGNAVP